MLIAKKDLNEVFAQYHPELDKCGNRVYWIQHMDTENDAYPITNVYADCVLNAGICVFYKYIDYSDMHSYDIASFYGYYWRLFDFPPTKEERNIPWDYIITKKIAEIDLSMQETIKDEEAIERTKDRITKTNVFLFQNNNMKKSDLKPGMIVVTRDCEYYTVTDSKIENRMFYIQLNSYNDDMLIIGNHEWLRDGDIMKVYDSTFKELLFERKE